MAKKTKQNKIEIIETKDNLTQTPQTEEMKSSSEVFVVETDGTVKEIRISITCGAPCACK